MKTKEFTVLEAAPGATDQPVICTACYRHCTIGYLAVVQTPPSEWEITIDVPADCPLNVQE